MPKHGSVRKPHGNLPAPKPRKVAKGKKMVKK